MKSVIIVFFVFWGFTHSLYGLETYPLDDQGDLSAFTILSATYDTYDTFEVFDTSDTSLDEMVDEHTEGQWFLGYRYGELDQGTINLFTLKRGYITIKNRFDERWSVRYTQDITLDQEGSDRGNVEFRLKYCYIQYETNDFFIFSDPAIEAGMVHRPWIDFEQDVNPYRVQGTMFLERVGILSSADFGITFSSLLGGKIGSQYQKRVNNQYPGRYGSFSIGIYNGGGYHALEYNQSKNLESRVTLRPFPRALPGLQFTYNLALGKGNTELAPDFIMHSGFVSYESQYLTLTGQYYSALGNSSGSYAGSSGRARHNEGYSVFSEYQIPQTPFTLFGRYDHFDSGMMDFPDSRRFILGAGYYFFRQNKLIIDVDALDKGLNGNWNSRIYEAALEIQF